MSINLKVIIENKDKKLHEEFKCLLTDIEDEISLIDYIKADIAPVLKDKLKEETALSISCVKDNKEVLFESELTPLVKPDEDDIFEGVFSQLYALILIDKTKLKEEDSIIINENEKKRGMGAYCWYILLILTVLILFASYVADKAM